MSNEKTYAVLMAVYKNDHPVYFQKSMESMLGQTVAPSELIIVCDGPLTDALESVLASFIQKHPDICHVVRLAQNGGLGVALREGLQHCTYETIVRMDSDDIAKPDRCEKLLALMEEKGLDACSSYVEEIASESEAPLQTKRLPLEHEEILRYMKWRNPLNHPAVAFKKASALAAGSYRHMPFFEDYDLWIRMKMAGARFGNSGEVLLFMRVNEAFYARRGGMRYAKANAHFWKAACKEGFIGPLGLALRVCVRGAVSLLPNAVRGGVYKKVLR